MEVIPRTMLSARYWKPIRVPVDQELRARLEAVENRVAQQHAAQAQGASASP